MNRHKPKFLVFVMQIMISGCVSPTAIHPVKLAEPHGPARPYSLTQYIKAVYKVSHEGAVQDSDAYERLIKENAEIEALAKHVGENPNDLKSKQRLALEYLDHGLNWRAYELLAQLEAALPLDAGIQIALARIWDPEIRRPVRRTCRRRLGSDR